MGQYYMPILGNETGERWVVYNRTIDKEYTTGKLLEHSWWNNGFCNALSAKLYKKKRRLIWCGDYADKPNDFNFKIDTSKRTPSYKSIWGDKVKKIGIKKKYFTLDNKFLVNHDTKEYLDLQEYKHNSATTYSDGYVDWINPLPLLTAVGNGRGGGDFYHAIEGEDKVGIWAWNLISIETEPPKDYKKIDIRFIENTR